MEDLLKSNAALCPLVVHLEGGIEDADSNAIQVWQKVKLLISAVPRKSSD